MGCFWTDHLNAKEDCGADGVQLVDGLVKMLDGQQFARVPEWTWSESAMYSPVAPAPPGEGIWVYALGPAAAAWQVRNTVVGGALALPMEDFAFDWGARQVRTVGAVSIPGTNATGGAGAYTATGFVFDMTNRDLPGVYDALPPELKYPDWVNECRSIPRRRTATRLRSQVDVSIGYNPSATTMEVMATGTVHNGAPVGLLSQFSEEVSFYAETDPGQGGIGPWSANELTLADYITPVLSVTMKPSALGDTDFDGWVRPEIKLGAPGLIDAYLGDCEFFELEQPQLASFELPAAGSGLSFPGLRYPVFYDESSEGSEAGWGIGTLFPNTEFRNPHPPAQPDGNGAVVGTLYSSAGSPICRLAILIGYSGN